MPSVELYLFLSEVDSDAEDLDRAARQLQAELHDLEVESVELIQADDVPVGAKAADPALIGALVVAAVPVVLPKLLEFLHAWSMRREGRTVKIKVQTEAGAAIEVEFSETTPPEKVKAWIKLVSASLPKKGK